jgi:hypothetical protein
VTTSDAPVSARFVDELRLLKPGGWSDGCGSVQSQVHEELFDLIRRFCGDAADLVESWDATAGAPTDASLRRMLERTLRLIESPASVDMRAHRGRG